MTHNSNKEKLRKNQYQKHDTVDVVDKALVVLGSIYQQGQVSPHLDYLGVGVGSQYF